MIGPSDRTADICMARFPYDRARGGGTRPGTEKRCSHNLQSDPLGSGFKKGRENFPL